MRSCRSLPVFEISLTSLSRGSPPTVNVPSADPRETVGSLVKAVLKRLPPGRPGRIPGEGRAREASLRFFCKVGRPRSEKMAFEKSFGVSTLVRSVVQEVSLIGEGEGGAVKTLETLRRAEGVGVDRGETERSKLLSST